MTTKNKLICYLLFYSTAEYASYFRDVKREDLILSCPCRAFADKAVSMHWYDICYNHTTPLLHFHSKENIFSFRNYWVQSYVKQIVAQPKRF